MRRSPTAGRERSQRVVYVAAEGPLTEGDYVDWLAATYGRDPGQPDIVFVSPGRNGARPREVVELVVDRADADAEKWALFDRDSTDHRDAEIGAAMRLAARHGVQVALSHPCFELWLLLHFQQWTSQEHGRADAVLHRLRTHPDAEGFAQYDKASGPRGKGIDQRRWAALAGREQTAIRNAQRLVDRCPYGSCAHLAATTDAASAVSGDVTDWQRHTGHDASCDPLLRDPSSDVWRLLVSLGAGAVGTVPQQRGTGSGRRTPEKRKHHS